VQTSLFSWTVYFVNLLPESIVSAVELGIRPRVKTLFAEGDANDN
jgi:hypothetical protein